MGTVLFQGLQPCLETQLVESRAIRLMLSSPKPHFPQPLELTSKPCLSDSNMNEPEDQCHYEEVTHKAHFLHGRQASSNPDLGGWSFLRALSNTSQGLKESTKKESTYVHPLVKRSSSRLSEKSLQLCTENLGSETGTDIIENSVFSLSPSESKAENSPAREQLKPRKLLGDKKGEPRSFPPPLTTMSGSETLRVRPHREDGRLIIKTVKAPSVHTNFQAERSRGRLRLCLVKDSAPNFDAVGAASTEENERENEGNSEKVELENDMNHDEVPEEEEGEETIEGSEEKVEEADAAYCTEEVNGNELDVGAELGLEGFQRPSSRCKEGGRVEKTAMTLLRWEEPFGWLFPKVFFCMSLSGVNKSCNS